jgi:hypothetical protein
MARASKTDITRLKYHNPPARLKAWQQNGKRQEKKKPPLTAKDLPDAPIGQATDPQCVCFFGWVCEEHHDKPNHRATTTAAARAIPALEKAVHIGVETLNAHLIT